MIEIDEGNEKCLINIDDISSVHEISGGARIFHKNKTYVSTPESYESLKDRLITLGVKVDEV